MTSLEYSFVYFIFDKDWSKVIMALYIFWLSYEMREKSMKNVL